MKKKYLLIGILIAGAGVFGLIKTVHWDYSGYPFVGLIIGLTLAMVVVTGVLIAVSPYFSKEPDEIYPVSYSIGEALTEYECGCTVHKDSYDVYIINWCSQHRAPKEWLSNFVMKFYIQAENPTYETMKKLYTELDDFTRNIAIEPQAEAERK